MEEHVSVPSQLAAQSSEHVGDAAQQRSALFTQLLYSIQQGQERSFSGVCRSLHLICG